MTDQTTTDQPVDQPAQDAPATEAPQDTRQRWVCVDTFGRPTGHPVFYDDSHLGGQEQRAGIACPQCGSRHVQEAEFYPNLA